MKRALLFTVSVERLPLLPLPQNRHRRITRSRPRTGSTAKSKRQ
jgi:hypothetical protein